MTIIDNETVVIYNFAELKTVLEGNNTYNLIYLGADITGTLGGIRILNIKEKITIDGTYDNVRYTYTDYNSAAYTDTILLINTPTNMNITVQNLDVVGRNYYGIVCVFDASGYSNVVVNYNNINYNGPQMAFNPYSSLNITDCEITIQSNGIAPANEVAETRNITLGGNVNIHSVATGTSIFWFRNVVGGVYPYLNVLPGANVSIQSENRYLYYVSSAAYINMTFGTNSITNIETATGISYDNSHLTRNVLIDNDAILNIEQKEQFGTTATWSISGEFKMNSGSTLKMISDYSGSTANYSLRFAGTSASFNLNNPSSVVLYNRPANAIHVTATIPFSLNVSQYNRWMSLEPFVSAGDIHDIPTYSWYKIENTSNLIISGNITTASTTNLTTNLTPTEESELPALSNFLINQTKVLSFGRPSLTINPITDLVTEISGMTTPNADVKISYDGNDYYVQSDSAGAYTYIYTVPLPIGTEISFVSNLANSFLYRFRTVEVIYPGDLAIKSSTSQVEFTTTPFQTSPDPTLCNRITPLKVVVEDNRITPTVWRLYAFINEPLTNEDGRVLTDGIVFVDDLDNLTVLSSSPTLVYTSDGVTTGDIEVEWQSDEGILLQLNIVPIVAKTTYRTNINWLLE